LLRIRLALQEELLQATETFDKESKDVVEAKKRCAELDAALKNAEAKFQILIERDDNENEIEICCGSAFRNKKMDFRRFTETHWSVKHVERIFFQYDKNGSGKLERKEAKAFFLDWFGKKSWKDEQEKEKLFEEFMSIFDSDGSNSLEFSELLRNNFFEDRVLGPARSFIYDLAHLFTHIFFIFRLSVIFFLSIVARLRSRLR